MIGTRKPRVRPWLRRVAIVVFALAVPIAAHALWGYVEMRRLIREIDAIRAAGEPVSERSAGRGYRKLSKDEALAGRYFMAAALLAYPATAPDRGAVSALHEHVTGRSPNGFDEASFRQRLKIQTEEGAAALALADRATTLPFNGFSPGTSYNYRLSELGALLSLQCVRTAYLSLSMRGDEAVESAIQSIKTRPVMQESLFESWLRPSPADVSVVLSLGSPSTSVLRRLLAEFRALDQSDVVERTVLADRASYVENMLTTHYGVDAEGLAAYGPRDRNLLQPLLRPWITREFIQALRSWRELVAASRKSWPQKGTEMAAIYARLLGPRRSQLPFSSDSSTARGSWVSPSRAAALSSAMFIFPRTFEWLSRDRASAAAVAIALYRADHAGELPAALEDLAPAYLHEVPVDPATGQPLKYKRDSTSFTVYSVGSDGTDDGGDLTSYLTPVAERNWQRQLRGRDTGIRVLIHHGQGRD